MKKVIAVILLCFSILILPACSKTNTAESDIPQWLSGFYDSDYEYTKSEIILENNTEEVSYKTEGKVIASPYKEYEKILEPDDSLWTEAYYYESGSIVNSVINTVSQGYVRQRNIQHPYPRGYGEKLKFTENGTEKYQDTECDVYLAEYSIKIDSTDSGKNDNNESITASISQKYYVDPEKEELVCMITDLTDLYEKQDTGTQETEDDRVQILEVMEISYDDIISIEIPDI